MQVIELSSADWTMERDFYASLLASLGAPVYHGHSMDALWDSITGGEMNRINPPFTICVRGTSTMPASCKAVVDRFANLISDAKAEGWEVDITCD